MILYLKESRIMISSLLADLKQLRNSKPEVEPPRNRSRMERVMQFEKANGISLAPDAPNRKKTVRRGGMFDDTVFCFPLIDPANDPPPDRLVQLAKGIYSQGGKLLQFTPQLTNKNVKYILIDERSDVGVVREVLRGRVLYVAIINYRWVEECLRKLAKVELAPYNLERNYKTTEGSRAQARRKLEEEEPNNSRKRAINEFITNTTKQVALNGNKNACSSHPQPKQEENESDSDTVIMEEPQQKQQYVEHPQSQIKQEFSEVKQQQRDVLEQQGTTVKIEQQMADIFPETSEVKQQQAFQEAKLEEDSEHDYSSFPDTSRAFEWSEPNQTIENEGNDSDATEKMDSDSEVPTKPPPKPPTKPVKSSIHQQLKLLPQVTRRKTKLALGSHLFATNNMICQKLKQMQQIYENTGDRKQYAYLRAIAAIRNYGREIKNAEELKNIEGLGRKTIDKIREFLKTGSITKVEQRLSAKNSVPHKELLRVHGIGLNTAEGLAHKGIKTLQDLRQNENLLNRNQRMGLKYVDDFQQRIPRQKVARMLEFVKQTLFYVVRSDSHHEVEAVGSFRRGKATCGDIDILVTRRDGAVEKGLLTQLVIELERRGFITDHITQPRPFDGKRSVNYMGVCQLDGGLHHRIDLKLYPVDQYAFALLYFTGSDLFNRQMRMNAAERGLILGDSGVRRKERNVGKAMQNSKLCACFTEKDVFKLLDMEYRPPSQRQL